jgi:hypothetical protein
MAQYIRGESVFPQDESEIRDVLQKIAAQVCMNVI